MDGLEESDGEEGRGRERRLRFMPHIWKMAFGSFVGFVLAVMLACLLDWLIEMISLLFMFSVGSFVSVEHGKELHIPSCSHYRTALLGE